jgi:hypothetical protein
MSRNPVVESLLGTLTVGVWALVCRGPSSAAGSAPQAVAEKTAQTLEVDELVVKRLRVVEEDGKDRVVIAGAGRFPRPRLGGKEYPRSIAPAGMLFYRSNGDECGGVAVVDSPQGTSNMMILDYANCDAIGFGVSESPDGTHSAGISISDRPPLDADPLKAASMVHQRLVLGNAAGRVDVMLADPQGKPRITLSVDADGVPALRILDEDGKPLFEAP